MRVAKLTVEIYVPYTELDKPMRVAIYSELGLKVKVLDGERFALFKYDELKELDWAQPRFENLLSQ